MRILFLTNLYPPHDLGGYEQWCQEVADRLKDRGHQIAVLTSTFRADPAAAGLDQPISRVLHLQTDPDYYEVGAFFLRRQAQNRENRALLTQKIERFQPDLIFVWGMWLLTHKLPRWAEELLPGRVAYFISSYWPMDEDPHRQYWKLPANRPAMELIKQPLRYAALKQLAREQYPPQLQFEHAVCCSHFVRQRLIDAGKLPESAGVLYGGCDPASFDLPRTLPRYDGQRPLELLYFGRLIHDKGVHTAIEALGHLHHQGLVDRVRLTILGSGHPEYEALLRQMTQDHKVQEQVVFKGKVAREEIPAELARYDVFLFTSIWPEPMARSVMEAMAAGLLVIGTEAGGQREMLHHRRNALTFAADDAEQLAAQIVATLQQPDLVQTLAAAGQDLVRRDFTLARMVDDIENMLAEVVAEAA